MVYFAPEVSATYADRVVGSIHPNIFDSGQVYDQAFVANTQTATIVAATPDGYQQVVFPPKVYGINNIGNIQTLYDHSRMFIDHAIIDLSGLGIVGIRWHNYFTLQLCGKSLYFLVIQFFYYHCHVLLY
jgi:hypothetical protein